MKTKILLFVWPLLFFGCHNNGEKSDAFGNFEADAVIVSSESQGKIVRYNVERGQKMDSGFLAAIIDTVQPHLKLEQLDAQMAAVHSKKRTIQAQIAVLEQEKENLLTNKRRIEKMLDDNAATQKELDDVTGRISVIEKQMASTKTQFTSVEREVHVLETQRKAARDMLRRCQVRTPAGGTVLETYAEQGELVTPGKPLFKIAGLETVTLKVYVSGAQLPNIKIGQQVQVFADQSATENQSFPGKITWIASEAEFTPKIIQTKEERVNLVYAVKVKVRNDGTLKIGMPGEFKWE